jgi:hypothetical protein
MATKEEISDAIAVEKSAHEAYIAARERRESLQVTFACEQWQVGIGKIVVDTKGRKGVVVRVRPWDDMKPWIFAKQIKKDGSTGDREIQMFDRWTVI